MSQFDRVENEARQRLQVAAESAARDENGERVERAPYVPQLGLRAPIYLALVAAAAANASGISPTLAKMLGVHRQICESLRADEVTLLAADVVAMCELAAGIQPNDEPASESPSDEPASDLGDEIA